MQKLFITQYNNPNIDKTILSIFEFLKKGVLIHLSMIKNQRVFLYSEKYIQLGTPRKTFFSIFNYVHTKKFKYFGQTFHSS